MAEITVENITPDKYDDNFVVDCARVSFAKRSSQFTPEQNERLIRYLFNPPDSVPHWAPFAGPRIGYTVILTLSEFAEFMLMSNLRGFVIDKAPGKSSGKSSHYLNLDINGSLWAWFENLDNLPNPIADTIENDLAKMFPTCAKVFGWEHDPHFVSSYAVEFKTNTKIANLRIKAPIFVARQLVKHQVDLVWSEVSRRYISSEPELWWPEEWHKAPTHSKQGASEELYSFEDYALMGKSVNPEFEMNEQQFKDMALDMVASYNLAVASGMAPEEARMILPQNMMTEWIWTGTYQAFHRVLRERLAPGAQKSGTRETAEKIAKALGIQV